MKHIELRYSLLAAAAALSLLTPAVHAQAQKVAAPAPTVGEIIAEQGNAALRLIRAEMKATVRLIKPVLPAQARAKKVAAPAAGSAPVTAALAK